MKFMNNWLGFSLSPQMTMQEASASAAEDQTQVPNPSPFFLNPPPQFNRHLSPFYGGHPSDNTAYHLPRCLLYCSKDSQTSMSLKSDGSFCIMDALTSSQGEGLMSTSTPKLEDFLGGAAMSSHQYGDEREATMPLSLDSLYYQQSPTNLLGLHHTSLSSLHQGNLCTTMNTHDQFLHESPSNHEHKEHQHLSDFSLQYPPIGDNDLKPWVKPYSYTSCGIDQKMCDETNAAICTMSYGELQQSLGLSMSPGSQSSCVTTPHQISPTGTDHHHHNQSGAMVECKKKSGGKMVQKQPVHRKSIDTFGQRTSQYRGVTRHRWTGRYEAHLWDNSCKKEGQTRKGRQVYLGGYDMEEKAAKAYDLAALKYWGPSTHTNFLLENYSEELEHMKNMSRQDYVAHLRRKSSGFSRGASMYRGVTRHHQHGRWQARIGRVAGNKDLYLGTFSTQEEAAEAYDIAAIKFRGVNAVTNFDIVRYDVERIMVSNTLLGADMARRNREIVAVDQVSHDPQTQLVDQSDLHMVLYQTACSSSPTSSDRNIDKKPENGAPFLSAMNENIGIANDSVPSDGIPVNLEEQNQVVQMRNLSNASTFIASLSSSTIEDVGEGSPDKTSMSAGIRGSHDKLTSPSPLSAWMSASLPRTPIPMAHFPLFAAWSDT